MLCSINMCIRKEVKLMASKTKKLTKTNSGKSEDSKGKKGGLSVVSPEMVGAMTGAAIGGVAGLMLANKKTRENLAVVKDKAVDTAGEILDNVHIETSGTKEDIRANVNQISESAQKKMDKSLPKNK